MNNALDRLSDEDLRKELLRRAQARKKSAADIKKLDVYKCAITADVLVLSSSSKEADVALEEIIDDLLTGGKLSAYSDSLYWEVGNKVPILEKMPQEFLDSIVNASCEAQDTLNDSEITVMFNSDDMKASNVFDIKKEFGLLQKPKKSELTEGKSC